MLMNPKYLFGCSCYFYISVFCFDRFNLSWAGPERSIPVLPMPSKLWLWLLLQGRCGYGDRGDKHSTQKADFWRSLFKIVQSPYALKSRKTLMRVSGHNSSTSRKRWEKMLRSSTSSIQAFATAESMTWEGIANHFSAFQGLKDNGI